MKNIYSFLFILFMSIQLQADPVRDTVSMGAGYANDVFYSLDSGIVKIETRANWEIAFYTNRWSAGIQMNDGGGVKLFTYPLGDKNAWNNVDVSQIDEWTPMVNSDTVWEDGAFNRHALGHPDYGWGVYNTINHSVNGDSLFIVKLANGSLKKLFIEAKNSVTNTYFFKYADIDGSNEKSEVLDITPYMDNRMFLYYSLSLGMAIDREPDINSWDLVFSRYSAIVYDNNNQPSDYVVVGIASNNGVGVAKHHPVEVGFADWMAKPFEEYRTPIGHEWKEFSMSQFAWTVEDSLVYFIKNRNGNIYKFFPEFFSGQATGSTTFVKELLSFSGLLDSHQRDNALVVSPNPTSGLLRLGVNDDVVSTAEVVFYDLAGKRVHSALVNDRFASVDLRHLHDGLYIAEMRINGRLLLAKVMLQH